MLVRIWAPLLAVLLFAATAPAKVVYVYDMQFGGLGSADGQMEEPMSVYVRGTSVVVADKLNSRVQVFNTNGDFVRKFGGPAEGSGSTGLAFPSCAVFDNLLSVFVLDSSNGRLVKLNAACNYANSWGSDGTGPQQFQLSIGLAIDDANSCLYVADTWNNRISKLTKSGTFLKIIGGPGTGNGQFNHPNAIAVDESGYVWVADTGNHRIQKLTSEGGYLTGWDGTASGTAFVAPAGICTYGGYVFVSDAIHNCIEKYRNDGTYITSFGSEGHGNGELGFPAQLCADTGGRIYVADRSNDRIQRFVPNSLPTAPTSVTIVPALPRDNNKLTANPVGSTDADDDLLTYQYKWSYGTNNSTWGRGPTTRSISAASTSVGQYWKVAARAYDGKSFSAWRYSSAVRIRPALTFLALQAAAGAARSGTITATISLNQAASVELQVCNMAGRVVAVAPAQSLPEGVSSVAMPAVSTSGTALPAGQYLLRVRACEADGRSANAVCAVTVR